FCELLREYLTTFGFQVEMLHDGTEALRRLGDSSSPQPDALILDVMLPNLDGMQVLRRIRLCSDVPVLMLTARGEELDRITGLELGADDYLPKPCNPRELLARLQAILRRAGRGVTGSGGEAVVNVVAGEILRVGDVEMEPSTGRVRVGGAPVELTGAEFALLHSLLRRVGQVVHKNVLSEEALGRQLGRFDRSIDTHVSRLRQKLGPGPRTENRIRTVRGMGYQYVLALDDG
ncbi:MAG: response regulator transcription factor, partial [Magnetococcales bacterium]|nr:response regulator transcription factor [Magnetococcales bacterium]